MASDAFTFAKTNGKFKDRYRAVDVFELAGGAGDASAFVYQCHLNLDKDGAPNAYGWDNPKGLNTAKDADLQKNLTPLEFWVPADPKRRKRVTASESQKIGLGNACGDPADGSKGWKNFLYTSTRNFYWAGVHAIKQSEATAQLVVDVRPELEAGRRDNKSAIEPKGQGYFPVVQSTGDAPAKGYYVSTTSGATDITLNAGNPTRYLNSAVVPYTVLANHWAHLVAKNGKKLALGDFGLAIDSNTGANCGLIYGDTGTPDKVGESSQKLHDTMSPGGNTIEVTFLAFPGSGTGDHQSIGKSPECLIRPTVLPEMLKICLATNANELPRRIVTGRTLALSKKDAKFTPDQARRYQNVMSALFHWGIWNK